jgi:hypothetical protein
MIEAGLIWASVLPPQRREKPRSSSSKSDERLIVGLAVLPRIDRPLFILTLKLLRRVQ